ncbi:MAG: ABC transporter substrate-binding protein [Candidatus Hodarchaeales archaeon]
MKNKLRNAGILVLVAGLLLATLPIQVQAATEELTLDLWYMPVERPYFPDAKSVAEIMQADLADIGITTNLKTYEWGEYLDRTEDGEHDMALLGWSADIGDPDNFLYVLLSGDSAVVGTAMNIAFYDNDAVDTLLTQAQQTYDQSTRDTLYKDACWLIHKDSPWITVAHSQNLAGVSNDVTGYVTHPTGQGANVYANVSVAGKTSLVIGRGGDAVTLDPAEWTDGQSWKVGRQIYDGLYNLPANSIDPVPALATNYTASADGLEWTFSLRQGVKFHDGTDFNASSVVFSFERAKYWSDNTSEYYINGWAPPEAGYYDYIYGSLDLTVEEVDTYTVKFTLNKKYAPFLATLAMGVFAIVSPTYVMAHNGTQNTDRLGLNPVGTGPYKMKEWVVDSTITLEKFDDYWGAAPKEDQVIFKVITEAATRIAELKSGDIDILDNVAASDAKAVEDDTGLTLVSQAGMNVGYLAMNALRYPFNDTTQLDDPDFGGKTTRATLIRRAFHYAVNRTKIIEEVYDGRAIQAKNPLPPSFWGYNDSIQDYAFDQAHARELLELAGIKTSGGRTTGFDALSTILTSFGAFGAVVLLVKRKRR